MLGFASLVTAVVPSADMNIADHKKASANRTKSGRPLSWMTLDDRNHLNVE